MRFIVDKNLFTANWDIYRSDNDSRCLNMLFFYLFPWSLSEYSKKDLTHKDLTEYIIHNNLFLILRCHTQFHLDAVIANFPASVDIKKVQMIAGKRQQNSQVLMDSSENWVLSINKSTWMSPGKIGSRNTKGL